MGLWVVLPIPREWKDALEKAVKEAPTLASHPAIADLLRAPTDDQLPEVHGHFEGI